MNATFLRRAAVLVLSVLTASAALAHEYTHGSLRINHPWARASVPGQKNGGAFVALRNAGTTPDRLLGGSTPVAERLELHTMSMEGDVMRMRELHALELPAGQTVTMQPGQMHLMLIGLKSPLKRGAKVPVTLKFEKAGEVQVEFWVESGPAGADHGGKPAAAHHHQH